MRIVNGDGVVQVGGGIGLLYLKRDIVGDAGKEFGRMLAAV
jgi:hypothetical protein